MTLKDNFPKSVFLRCIEELGGNSLEERMEYPAFNKMAKMIVGREHDDGDLPYSTYVELVEKVHGDAEKGISYEEFLGIMAALSGMPTGIEDEKTSSNEKRRQEYAGTVRKCPSCGAVLQSFTAFCPSCGHEINVSKSSISDFASKLQSLSKDSDKIEFIRNFPIPNTKEDILEFAIFAQSQFRYEDSESLNKNQISEMMTVYAKMFTFGKFKGNVTLTDYNKAWSAKMKQVVSKAQILFANEPNLLKQIQNASDLFMQSEKQNKTAKIKHRLRILIPVIVLLSISMCSIFYFEPSRKVEKETQRLESIYQEAVAAIENGDFISAELKASQLLWTVKTDDWDSNKTGETHAEVWNQKRESLQVIINQTRRDSK